MCVEALEQANRELIEAVEAPPDTGHEERVDWIAAQLWAMAEGQAVTDHGRLQRLKHALRELERLTFDRRARHLRNARQHLDAYERRLGQ